MSELNRDALKAARTAMYVGYNYYNDDCLKECITAYLAALPKQEPSEELLDLLELAFYRHDSMGEEAWKRITQLLAGRVKLPDPPNKHGQFGFRDHAPRDANGDEIDISTTTEPSGWRDIASAPRNEKVLFWLDWADDCKELNDPMAPVDRLFLGKYGGWSSIFQATYWSLPDPPKGADE
jgi:hypothetical protein